MFVPLEEFAVANAELGQRGSLISCKLRLGLVDRRRDFPQNWIGAEISDDATDGVCVDGLDGVFVVFWGHRSGREERRDDVGVFCSNGFLHAARAGILRDERERAVGGAHGRRKELGAEHVGMVFDGQFHHLLVKMLSRRRRMAASCESKRSILHRLQLVKRTTGHIRRPDRSAVV